jgi:biotin carboxyl carrier protein
MRLRVTVGGRSFEVQVDHEQFVWLDGEPLYVQLEQVGGLPVYSLAAGEEGHVLFVEEGQGEYQVEVQGRSYTVRVEDQQPELAPRPVRDAPVEMEKVAIRAPLAGRLAELLVAEGDRVESGDVVAIVESMKMQISIRSPQAGEVIRVNGPAGRDLDRDEDLVTFCPGE